eukprot:Tamp_15274.p7 GENE.Tamp_15274~~Tamp_15274.p7  ORF type:complete len:111 (-),score=2.39 Tamp_15274:215-547(-)
MRARVVWLAQRHRIHTGQGAAPARPAPGDHPLAHGTPPVPPSTSTGSAGASLGTVAGARHRPPCARRQSGWPIGTGSMPGRAQRPRGQRPATTRVHTAPPTSDAGGCRDG